jgi:hypothetical protein
MGDDHLDKFGPMLSEIGGVAAELVGGDPNGLYLYVEVGDRWFSVNLFRDEGAAVRYYRSTPELNDLIYEFSQSEDHDKRWSVMEFEINGTKFDAQFKFPDEVDVEDFDMDRREIALKNRFGDKPVIYPPWPGAASEE